MTATPVTADTTAPRYLRPSPTEQRFNRVARWLTAHGVSIRGSRVLTVAGRRSGQPRSTIVNLLVVDGQQYLVSPRGTTDWVRNVRAAHCAELRVGRHRDQVTLVELDDDAKPELLREYLRRWAFEVGAFFEGVGADASAQDLAAIAPNHPVFRVEAA